MPWLYVPCVSYQTSSNSPKEIGQKQVDPIQSPPLLLLLPGLLIAQLQCNLIFDGADQPWSFYLWQGWETGGLTMVPLTWSLTARNKWTQWMGLTKWRHDESWEKRIENKSIWIGKIRFNQCDKCENSVHLHKAVDSGESQVVSGLWARCDVDSRGRFTTRSALSDCQSDLLWVNLTHLWVSRQLPVFRTLQLFLVVSAHCEGCWLSGVPSYSFFCLCCCSCICRQC